MNDFEPLGAELRERGSSWHGPIHYTLETGSTNSDARTAAKAGAPAGSIWITEHQTSGRGRQGRVWHSSVGENLLFSLLLRPQVQANRMPPVTLAVGLGVLRSLSHLLGAETLGIKWPNDVVTRSDLRKVAGILVESTVSDGTVDALIVGVGINVNQVDFQEPIRSRATSLAALGGHTFGRCDVLANILRHVETCIDGVVTGGLRAFSHELARADVLLGKEVTSGTSTGVASGISPNGGLLLNTAAGMAEIGSGEVV